MEEEGINKFKARMLKTWSPFGKKGDIVIVCYWYPEESRAVNEKTDYVHFPGYSRNLKNCIDSSAIEFLDWIY